MASLHCMAHFATPLSCWRYYFCVAQFTALPGRGKQQKNNVQQSQKELKLRRTKDASIVSIITHVPWCGADDSRLTPDPRPLATFTIYQQLFEQKLGTFAADGVTDCEEQDGEHPHHRESGIGKRIFQARTCQKYIHFGHLKPLKESTG